MAETRRGRISQATYARVVGQMLGRDWFALDECEILTQLDLVEQLVTTYPSRYFTRGAAVRAILDRSINEVIASCEASPQPGGKRIVRFLEARRQGIAIAAIAREWGMTREYVSRTVGRQAIRLVTDRVLRLGRSKLADKAIQANRSMPLEPNVRHSA